MRERNPAPEILDIEIPLAEPEPIPAPPAPRPSPPPAPIAPVVQPVQVVQAQPAPPATKECPFCAELVLAAAKKCKHCGEVIDVALRAAEEAKAMAMRAQQSPIVINNNNSASAVAVVGGVPQRRGMSRLTAAGIVFLALGLAAGCGGATEAGTAMVAIAIPLIALGSCLSLARWLSGH